VVGDNRGSVGFGIGKARSVPDAIRKGLDSARKNMRPVPMVGNTIPHEIIGQHGAAKRAAQAGFALAPVLLPVVACAPCWRQPVTVTSCPNRWAVLTCSM
jgi:hypothetical protein